MTPEERLVERHDKSCSLLKRLVNQADGFVGEGLVEEVLDFLGEEDDNASNETDTKE